MIPALHTPGPPGEPGPVDAAAARLNDAGLLAVTGPGPLDVRTGVLAGPGTTALITGTPDTAPMAVLVAAHPWVTTRQASDGVYRGTTEAPTRVSIGAAPASGSRIDVVYVKQNDQYSTITPDGNSTPVLAVAAGTPGSGKPSIPVGAEELGTVTVAAGATRTDGSGVTITNTARQTVARGGIIPVRNKAERDAITGYDGQPVWRQDLNLLEILGSAAGSVAAVIAPPRILFTPPDGTIATELTAGSARGLHAAVTISQPFGQGVPFQGLVYASCYATIQGGSTLALGAAGDPATFRAGREQNTSGVAEERTVRALDFFDSGSADTWTFQPVLYSEVGTSNPFSDARYAYSIAVAFPKAL